MFKIVFTAALAGLAAAYTQPTGSAPVGNPISQPGLNSVVPAGENFTITWEPTTQGTVTLVLLKGPSTNAVPQYAIVEKTANDGVYVWQVASDLAPTENAMGYGIQLIDDATGQYQYTTQFGISNANYHAGASSSASHASATSSAPTYGTTVWTTSCTEGQKVTAGSSTWTVTKATTLTITETCSTSTPAAVVTSSARSSGHAPVGTGASSGILTRPANVTMVAPTGGYVPTTVATTTFARPSSPSSAATPSTTPYRGSASTVAASFFGLAAAGLVAAFMA